MLKIIDVEIDGRVIVPCPEKDFKPRRAAVACPKCKHFKGIGLMSAEADFEWHQKFVIRCEYIMERRTQILPEVIEE